ncbi:MAG TPA: nuclear transport factor 2 family protein [Flavobacterium sp.]|jgi:ketosteroid isomerase-like protein
MKKLFSLTFLFLAIICTAQDSDKSSIDAVLTNWHKAAAEAKFDNYFSLMSPDAIFIGTDATENWTIEQFKAFAKPFFDKGRAWDFKAVERNIYVGKNGDLAWFDEMLSTWMKICRGSGVMRKENGQWKIVHYVLSMTVPNDNAIEVVKIKQKLEDQLLEQMKKK